MLSRPNTTLLTSNKCVGVTWEFFLFQRFMITFTFLVLSEKNMVAIPNRFTSARFFNSSYTGRSFLQNETKNKERKNEAVILLRRERWRSLIESLGILWLRGQSVRVPKREKSIFQFQIWLVSFFCIHFLEKSLIRKLFTIVMQNSDTIFEYYLLNRQY